jgi:hypothetical protein
MAFRAQYPHGTLETRPLTIDVERGFACFEAVATTGEGGRAVAHGSETRAGFEDFIERSETRAVGRCLGLLGFGTEYALEVDELPHVADAPVASTTGQPEPESDMRPHNGIPGAIAGKFTVGGSTAKTQSMVTPIFVSKNNVFEAYRYT